MCYLFHNYFLKVVKERKRDKFYYCKTATQAVTLKDNASAKIYDFSSYNPLETDAPDARSSRLGSNNREQRYTKRNYRTKAEEIFILTIDHLLLSCEAIESEELMETCLSVKIDAATQTNIKHYIDNCIADVI